MKYLLPYDQGTSYPELGARPIPRQAVSIEVDSGVNPLTAVAAMGLGAALTIWVVLYTPSLDSALPAASFGNTAGRAARSGAASTVDWHRIRQLAHDAGTRYGVPPELVWAVIVVESRLDQNARSHKGASGLMQLMPKTAEALGVKNPMDPAENIFGGTRYLRRLIARYDGKVKLAIAAYNAGPTAVAKYKGVPPYGETRRYVEQVLAEFEREKAKYAPIGTH